MLNIAAVTVAVHWHEYFEQCVCNRRFFQRWVVVTSEEDTDTIRLCREHRIETVITQVPFEMGVSFPRGRMVNEGLARLRNQYAPSWILHIDGDVVLPDNAGAVIEDKVLEDHDCWDCLYTAAGRRHHGIVNYAVDFTTLPCRNPRKPPNKTTRGVCAGYFQLWHVSRWHEYPEDTDHLADDVIFAQHWGWAQRRPVLGLMLNHVRRPGGCHQGRTAKRYKTKVDKKKFVKPR